MIFECAVNCLGSLIPAAVGSWLLALVCARVMFKHYLFGCF